MKHNLIWASGLIAMIALFSFFLRPAEAQYETAPLETDILHPIEVFQGDSTALTITDAFAQAGVAYYPEDIVSAFPDPSLGLGSIITVQRAMPIILTDGKKTYAVRTWQNTVADILKEKNIILGDEDRVSPTLATSLQLNMPIAITRVARTTITETERIIYKTIENNDSTLYRGNNIVTQEGQNGSREKKYLVIREDGELVSKTLTSNVVTKAVVNKVVRVGTKLKIGKIGSGKATWYPYPNRWGTKVASDFVRAGAEVRVTNLDTGKSIIVRVDGCIVICPNGIVGTTSSIIDLAPEYFNALGGNLAQGVLRVRVEEILSN